MIRNIFRIRSDPDRWMPEARLARSQFSYFPFDGGHAVASAMFLP
jgi:hypothetical protein